MVSAVNETVSVVFCDYVSTGSYFSSALVFTQHLTLFLFSLYTGLASMEKLVDFFKSGMLMSETKAKEFCKRSSLHTKLWRLFNILKFQLEHQAFSIRSLFSRFAIDSEQLDRSGIARILEYVQVVPPPTERQLDLFVNALDSDGNGYISEDEMMEFCLNGISQSDSRMKAFGQRSQFHAHLVTLFRFLST